MEEIERLAFTISFCKNSCPAKIQTNSRIKHGF